MVDSQNGGISRCLKYQKTTSRISLRHVVLSVVALVACVSETAGFSLTSVRSSLLSSQIRRTSLSLTHSIRPGSVPRRRHQSVALFTSPPSDSHHHVLSDFFPEIRISTADKIQLAVTAAVMIMAFGGLIHISGPGMWRYYLAGGICAATSHAITTPIDVVKTRKQVDSSLGNSTFVGATSTIIKTEGIHALLAGLGPTIVGYLFEGALKFGIYEVLKPSIGRFLAYFSRAIGMPFVDSKVIGFVLCGTVSGVAASAMLCPMEAIRIRQVAEPDFAPAGWVQAGLKMLKNEGFSGLWKGMPSMLYKQVPYTVTKNVSFDFLTTFSYITLRKEGYAMSTTASLMVPLLSAFAASILSCISSQPGDMLLSLVNAHEGNKTANDFLKQIYNSKRGLKGLFVGTNERFLHVGIIVTVQLLIYDMVKRAVGIAATGTV